MKYFKIFEDYKKEIKLSDLANLISKKLNYDNAEFIASGADGVVYSISDNLILKITNSKQEANIVYELIGKELKHIINYYNIFQIETKKYKLISSQLRFPYFDEMYFIIAEKCIVNNDIPKIITDIQNIMVDANIKISTKNFFKILLEENNLNIIKKYLDKFTLSPFLYLKSKDEFYNYYEQLVNIAKEMKNNNIENIDGHAWNFGIKNGNLCLFDILNKKRYKSNIKKINF